MSRGEVIIVDGEGAGVHSARDIACTFPWVDQIAILSHQQKESGLSRACHRRLTRSRYLPSEALGGYSPGRSGFSNT